MKKIKQLSIVLTLGSVLLVSSCSNQIYSYRSKVKVDPITAQTKKAETPKIASATVPVIPEKTVASNPLTQTGTMAEKPETKQVLKDIQQMVPQHGSKAFHMPGGKQFKSAKEQIKTLKKDIQNTQNQYQVDGIKWMIIGAILMIAAWILGVVGLGGGVVGAVASIGGIIFLVGLIFWLIDYLK